MTYQFITTQGTAHRVGRLCAGLGVSRSGYYAWRRRPASARTRANAQVLEQLQQLHRQTKARDGAVKMWHALLAAGAVCGRHRVARLRRLQGLEARRTRRFRMGVEQHQFAPPAPNRLHQVFVAPAVNRVWVGDLTAIGTRSGWLYLVVLLDLYSRCVSGWAMSAKPGISTWPSRRCTWRSCLVGLTRDSFITPIKGPPIPVWPTNTGWPSTGWRQV